MTKPTMAYLQLPTLRRLAPHLTPQIGLDSLVNRLCDAAGYGAADPYPATTTRDAQAALVSSHGYSPEYDLNGDLTVNAGDQALAAALGMPQSAPVTPPPTDMLALILHDMAPTPHDGIPNNDPNSVPYRNIADFDWGQHAAVQGALSANWPQMTGWGWASRLAGSDQNSNPRVYVRKRQSFIYRNGAYTRTQTMPLTWHDVYTTDTHNQEDSPDPVDWRAEADGSFSFLVPRDRSLHWAGDNPGIPVAPDYALLVVMEYRIAPTPGAKMLACTGADWKNGSSGRAGGVGRIKLLPEDGSWITGTYTSISASELQAHPPPV